MACRVSVSLLALTRPFVLPKISDDFNGRGKVGRRRAGWTKRHGTAGDRRVITPGDTLPFPGPTTLSLPSLL